MSAVTFREKTIEEMMTSRPNDAQSSLSFLSAVVKQSGTVTFVRKRVNLVISTDGYSEAMYLVDILKSLYPTEFEIGAEEIKSGAKKGTRAVTVSVPSGFTKQVLEDCGLVNLDTEFSGIENGIPERFSRSADLIREYFKGLFFSCGGIYVPSLSDDDEKRDGYHLEFRFDDSERADIIAEYLIKSGQNAKINERGALFLVYVKDKDEILNFLGALGLADSVMTLKRIIDERETSNSLNRAVICETANLDKTFTAASRQLLAIGLIEESVGLDSLSQILRDTARVRMEYPQASLNELADILGVTKSCLNHRLRKLTALADESGDEEEMDDVGRDGDDGVTSDGETSDK